MKEDRYFIYIQKDHIAYNFLKKGKIIAISKVIRKYDNSKGENEIFFKRKERNLFISTLFQLENLFSESFFTCQCILGNKLRQYD